MNSTKDYISRITKYIPIFTALSLVYGTISQSIYYHKYGINIFSYLELNEIVLITLKEFAVVFSSGIFFYISILITSSPTIKDHFKLHLDTSQPLYKILNKFIPIIILNLLMLVSVVISIYTNPSYDFIVITFALFITSIIFDIPLLVMIIYYKLNKRFPTKELLFLINIIAIILIYSTRIGFIKTQNPDKQNLYLKQSIILDGQLIKSTPQYYYVGKTNRWVFFYNEKDETADIFPMNKVDKLTL